MQDRAIHNGLYRHYKGGLYVVVGEVLHHETRLPSVAYFSLQTQEYSYRPVLGTPQDRDGWLDRVVAEGGKVVDRFEFVGQFPAVPFYLGG